MVENITPDETLDCRGLSCPMPLLKTKKAIKGMKSGQVIEIFSSDPGTKMIFPALPRNRGTNTLVKRMMKGSQGFISKSNNFSKE